jgi:hypothetical protein
MGFPDVLSGSGRTIRNLRVLAKYGLATRGP